MGMNISGFGYSNNYPYKTINTNSKQYQALVKNGTLDAIIAEELTMTPEERMIWEMFGGRETIVKNHMQMYDADGDLLNANGVAGMDVTGKGTSWQKLTKVSEDARQMMFDETLRHFKQEYGVANGDTTKRSEVFTAYQLSVPKKDRLAGTWTLGQYERAYTKAFYDAVKATNPNWELGQPFDYSILDSVTRESVDASLVQSGKYLVRKSINITV